MESRADRIIRWLVPTLGGVLVVAAYAFTLFLRAGSLFAGDGDPGRHIRVGTYILETRSIPHVDLFSHTKLGEPFIPFEWLSEVIFAGFHMLGGLAGVAVLTAILFAATVGLVYLTMVRAGAPTLLAFVFAFASLVLQAVHLHPRPHMFTTLLVAVFSFLLLEARRDGQMKRLLLLPPLMMIWANLHGGFLVGFILLFMFGIDAGLVWWRDQEARSARHAGWIAGVAGLCLVASLITPASWDLWPHATGYLREEWLVDFTQEYMSPDFHNHLLKFFLAALVLGTGVLAMLRSRVDLLGLATWILFSAFALHSGRNIPLFGVVALPWLAGWTANLADQDARPGSALTRFMGWARQLALTESVIPGWPAVSLGVVVLTIVALQPDRREVYRFSSDVFPVAAVEALLESDFQPPGPVYNEFGWGGYLLYRAWPEIPVFIDGQTDFYGEQLTREYVAIRALQTNWEQLLAKHMVTWALIPPEAPLAQGLELHPDWRLLYSDSTAVAFVRGTGAPAAVGEKIR